MRGLADTARMPDVRRCRPFLRLEILHQDQQMEMRLESPRDFSHSEMCVPRDPFSGVKFGCIVSLAFLSSPSVAVFDGPNSDNRNEACFATPRQASKIIAPKAIHRHVVFLSVRPNSSSEGERCMKDTDHPIRHPSRHPRIFGTVRRRRSCTWHDDEFGRGQNTGLGWSDPTFAHVSVPKVVRGVAPAQLRGDAQSVLSAQYSAAGGHSDEQRR